VDRTILCPHINEHHSDSQPSKGFRWLPVDCHPRPVGEFPRSHTGLDEQAFAGSVRIFEPDHGITDLPSILAPKCETNATKDSLVFRRLYISGSSNPSLSASMHCLFLLYYESTHSITFVGDNRRRCSVTKIQQLQFRPSLSLRQTRQPRGSIRPV